MSAGIKDVRQRAQLTGFFLEDFFMLFVNSAGVHVCAQYPEAGQLVLIYPPWVLGMKPRSFARAVCSLNS